MQAVDYSCQVIVRRSSVNRQAIFRRHQAATIYYLYRLQPPVSGQTINPISTRGADYAHHITMSPPPEFSDLATPLKCIKVCSTSQKSYCHNCAACLFNSLRPILLRQSRLAQFYRDLYAVVTKTVVFLSEQY